MSGIERVPGAGMLVDDEHTITAGNNRCQVVFKEDFDEICGTNLATLRDRDLFDDETYRVWDRAVSDVLTGDAEERTEQITLRPKGTGETYVYDLRVTPAEDGVRCVLHSVGTAQRHEETLTALHAATRDLMTADDVEAVLRKTAVAANEVLGFPGTAVRKHDPDAEMLRHVAFGARVENLDSRPPYPVDGSPHGHAIRRGETVIEDIDESDDPYDRGVFSQTMYIPIGETGILSIGTIGSSFTETDVQLAEILAENAAAAITVVDTTASLRRERERLEQFASVVSHDLRNPLGIAQTYLDFAEDTGDTDDFAAVREALDRMDTMIDDLLTLARTDATATETEPVDLRSLLDRSWEQVQSDRSTLRVAIPEGWTVHADPDLLQHVFENLFRNAIEHNEHPVTVTVGPLVDGFYVEDDGGGIPSDVGSDVFEHGVTTSDDGIGLGLSIVAEVTDAHGWEIAITDSDAGGARFEITTSNARTATE